MKKRRNFLVGVLFMALFHMGLAPNLAVGDAIPDDPFPIYFRTEGTITVDGNSEDWPDIIPFMLESDTQIQRGKRENPEEFAGKIRCYFDRNNLYLLAMIQDTTPLINSQQGNNIYQGDCLEVYLGFHDGQHTSYDVNDFQFGIALAAKEQKTWNWSKGRELNGQEIVIVKKSVHSYLLEAKIPWGNFERETVLPGSTVWIDFGLDNGRDGRERSTQLIWNGNGDGWQNPAVWRKAVVTTDEKLIHQPRILTPPEFNTEKYQRIYVWHQGKPWQGRVQVGVDQYITDGEGGFTLIPRQGRTENIEAVVDGHKIVMPITVRMEQALTLIALPVQAIKVNQLGYLPQEAKVFVLTDNQKLLTQRKFKIITALDELEVYNGVLVGPEQDYSTGDYIYYGDFTSFTRPGRYKIVVSDFGGGEAQSYVFEINSQVMAELFYTTMRSYYLQRCGTGINDRISGVKHEACHLQDGVLHENPNQKIDAAGGWHDAGDYGKYLPTAGVTVSELLLMYELSPKTFNEFSLDLPESGNGLPDLLNECQYELNWLVKMQDSDGGVFHKVNSANFPGMVMPEQDRLTRYVYEKGTADTAIFAGTMAIAARVFASFKPEYAEVLKKAAIRAGEFLMKTKNQILWPKNDNTGAYKTSSINDELYWAYSELFRMTGKAQYLKAANIYAPRYPEFPLIGWDNMIALGVYALLRAEHTPVELKQQLLNTVNEEAERITERVEANGYKVALRSSEYLWASNKNALAYGVNLILAYQFIPKPEFATAARKQLDYVLGVNSLSKSFITELGSDYVRYPHHRLAAASKQPVPGLLVGGPNDQAEDNSYPKGLGPRGYSDRPDAFACNENAIDYNAPLVFLAGYFMTSDIQLAKGKDDL